MFDAGDSGEMVQKGKKYPWLLEWDVGITASSCRLSLAMFLADWPGLASSHTSVQPRWDIDQSPKGGGACLAVLSHGIGRW